MGKFKDLIKDLIIAVVIALALLVFIKPTIVKGISMEPTLHSKDYLIISRQSYNLGDFERGEIIVFKSHIKYDNGDDKLLIKRIIGVPGDTIDIYNGKVYVNSKQVSSDYTLDGWTEGEFYDIEVPKDHVFVLGDNRQNSEDSRSSRVGLVEKKSILGRAFFRLYPFNQIGLI